MTKIKKYVDAVDDELCSAKEYAEKYVEYKAIGNMNRANKYKEMAQQELQHSMYLHQFSVEDIEELNKIYKPTQEMQDKWDKSHIKYVEKTALIKQMLTM